MKRETGYYWVNWCGVWHCAYFDEIFAGGSWDMAGYSHQFKDSDFEEIDENQIIRK